jgi:predicted GIY-YIG superfamily endonuclease
VHADSEHHFWADIPTVQGYAVYKLQKRGCNVVYVGSTNNLKARMRQHTTKGPLAQYNLYEDFQLTVLHGTAYAMDKSMAVQLEKRATTQASNVGMDLLNSPRIQGQPVGPIAHHIFQAAKKRKGKARQ